MKRQFMKRILVTVILTCMFSQDVMAGFKFPDVGKMASDAASGIAGAAGQAGDAITGAVEQAGDALSDAAQNIGKTASGAAKQIGDFATGFASQAGAVAAEWGQKAGETADGIKKNLSDAGVKVQVTATELGKATADKASELTEKAGKTADDAINAVTGAGNMVMDQAGHVVDLAAAGAGYVSSAAGNAFKVLQEEGEVLMEIAQEAVADIDLSDEQNWEEAKQKVETAIEKAYDTGVLKEDKVDKETVQIVTRITFGTLMYSYQYANKQITLGDYAGSMSEVIIKEGLPSGVGFIVKLLPIKVPNADKMAKEATYYLISVAYGDKSGEEIEAEEDALLEEVLEEKESVTEEITE